MERMTRIGKRAGIRALRLCWLILALITAAPAAAEDGTSLADITKNIRASGFNQTRTQLHEVDVENCILTFSHYQLFPGRAPVLISTITADVRGLTIPVSNMKEDARFLYIERGTIARADGISVTFFQMHEPFGAHLETRLNDQIDLTRISPKRLSRLKVRTSREMNFTIVHENQPNDTKTRAFIGNVQFYRDTYCRVLG